VRQVNRRQASSSLPCLFSTARRDLEAALRLLRASVAGVWVIKLSLIRLERCEIQAKWRAQEGAGGKSPWHMSKLPVINEALSNAYLRNSGLKSLKVRYQELRFV